MRVVNFRSVAALSGVLGCAATSHTPLTSLTLPRCPPVFDVVLSPTCGSDFTEQEQAAIDLSLRLLDRLMGVDDPRRQVLQKASLRREAFTPAAQSNVVMRANPELLQITVYPNFFALPGGPFERCLAMGHEASHLIDTSQDKYGGEAYAYGKQISDAEILRRLVEESPCPREPSIETLLALALLLREQAAAMCADAEFCGLAKNMSSGAEISEEMFSAAHERRMRAFQTAEYSRHEFLKLSEESNRSLEDVAREWILNLSQLRPE